MDAVCSIVVNNQIDVKDADTGIKVIKDCWHKIRESEGAAPKVKELVGDLLSSADVEKLERWEREKNDRDDVKEAVKEDVKEAVKEVTAISKQRLKCAPMLSDLLG